MPAEVRCPTCAKLLLGLSDDFHGSISGFCDRCKMDVGYPDLASVPASRLVCACGKWLARGRIIAGQAWAKCKRHRVLVIMTPDGVLPAEQDSPRGRHVAVVPSRPAPRTDPAAVVEMIEERWRMLRQFQVRRSVDVAVGIRFDVFNRDGFRCRYCGRGPAEGVFLEADHVIPRSAGGPDSMANLVTACWDCNRGKAAKQIAS